MFKFILASLLVLSCAAPVFAWDGFDYANGCYIEIDRGNLVRVDEDVEIYDYYNGDYHYVRVDDIYREGSDLILEVFDYQYLVHRKFEMDD